MVYNIDCLSEMNNEELENTLNTNFKRIFDICKKYEYSNNDIINILKQIK